MTTTQSDHAAIVATPAGLRVKITQDGQVDYLDGDGHVYGAPATERVVRDLGRVDADRDLEAILDAMRELQQNRHKSHRDD